VTIIANTSGVNRAYFMTFFDHRNKAKNLGKIAYSYKKLLLLALWLRRENYPKIVQGFFPSGAFTDQNASGV
jgi:hypothetical protein